MNASRPGILLLFGLWSAVLLAWPSDSTAQEREASPLTDPPYEAEAGPPSCVDYDSHPPKSYDERRWDRFRRSPQRRYDRRRSLFDSRHFTYSFPDPRRGYYPRYGYDYGPFYLYGSDYDFYAGYDEGYRDGRRFQQWEERSQRGLGSYLTAMQAGAELFRRGDYAEAAIQYILAAKLNQGDAASRLHAVDAMIAVGRYGEAAPALRRALQLQPKLVFLPLDVRSNYGDPADFGAQRNRLAEAATRTADDPDLWLLLGYWQFFSDQRAQAHGPLNRAAAISPDDVAVQTMLEAAAVYAPSAPGEPGKTAPAEQTKDWPEPGH